MGQQLAAPACTCDRRLCGIADDEPMVVVMGDLTMETVCYPDTGEASCSREKKEASVISASTADSRAADREREFLDLSGDGGFEETLALPETPGQRQDARRLDIARDLHPKNLRPHSEARPRQSFKNTAH
mmetsp:Transcript_13507/g.47635  ORF Transcript_13507/g.47635 Transcript_13507/m.47635 type:complete len:130 (+) Transcript_13507:71-460(+)